MSANVLNYKRLRVALIGLGRQTINDHVPALLRRADVEIVAVADPNTNSIDAFFESFTDLQPLVKRYTDYNVMFQDADLRIDFCIVAVPHNHYFNVIQALCSQNIPFMKEKPHARTLDEALVIESMPNISNLAFICTQRRFNPLYQLAYDKIGELGAIESCIATYTLDIPVVTPAWRKSLTDSGGGVIIDMGYHIIDQFMWWFGYPNKLSAEYKNYAQGGDDWDTEDTASLTLDYSKKQFSCQINLSRKSGVKQEYYQITGQTKVLQGNKKSLTIRDRENGALLEEHQLEDMNVMADEQLDYFIRKIQSGDNFADNHLQNLLCMKFIEKCYRQNIDKDQLLLLNHIRSTNLSNTHHSEINR